jgi:O-antigen ligase
MWLSPGVDAFLREYLLAYQRPAYHALSIDPGFTAVALGLYVAFGLLLVGLTRAIRYVRLDWLITQLLGLGIALAVVGILQKMLIDPVDPLVYGFWKPIYGGNPFGPFINRNHFAGWTLMALPLVAGYGVSVFLASSRPRAGSWRLWLRWLVTMEANRFVLVVFAVVAMGMALVLTGSRSGIASFAVVLGVMGYFLVARSRSTRHRIRVVASTLAVLAVAVLWAGLRETVARFARSSGDLEGRFAAWRDSWHIIRDFPMFGTGVGTYGQSMLVYQSTGREAIYLQAHNDYIQLAAEGGVLVVIPALLLLAVTVRAIWRQTRSGHDDLQTAWIRAGAIAGLLGIATQSLVEFSLQMPGNTIMFVLLASIAMHRPSRSTRARRV